jgi:quinol monooxygenase YgiN
MVIVQGVFRVEPNERERFLAQSGDNMQASRADKGCLEYVLAADPLDPGRVVLSERWESPEDLNQHGRAVAARRREAQASGTDPGPSPLSTEITVYEVASSRPLV